jgi:hypothetical protein
LRLTSAGATLVFAWYFAILFKRRRSVTPGPLPLRTVVSFAAAVAATVALLVNAIGPGYSPDGAVFGVGNLELFLR